MGTERASLFDGSHAEAVARDHDVDAASLVETLGAHQESVERLPGVENIVYEWRKGYEDPLIARMESAYYLVVPRTVWTEFAAALDLEAQMRDAAIETHRRAVATACDVASSPPEGQAYLALDRTM
jgi:hypothetical protein